MKKLNKRVAAAIQRNTINTRTRDNNNPLFKKNCEMQKVSNYPERRKQSKFTLQNLRWEKTKFAIRNFNKENIRTYRKTNESISR